MRNALQATGIPAAVVAHQGGWDEILLVVGPMILVAGLLWLAKRRLVRAERAQRAGEPTDQDPPNRTSDDLSPSA
jgi:hypothetical protein